MDKQQLLSTLPTDTVFSIGPEMEFSGRSVGITYVFITILAILFSLGSVLNIILIVVFVRRRSFRANLSNRFLVNLALVNVIMCLVLIPMLVLDGSLDVLWTLSPEGRLGLCRGIKGLYTGLSAAAMMAQLLIGIDQHLAVVQSLYYHSRINESRCLCLCLASWFLSAALGLVAGFDDTVFSPENPDNATITHHDLFSTCQHVTRSKMYEIPMTITVVTLGFLLPMVIMTIIYCKIFCVAHETSEKARRNSTSSTTNEALSVKNHNTSKQVGKFLDVNFFMMKNTPISEGSRTPSINSNASSIVTSVRSRINHASALLIYYGQIEEGRAAKVTILIMLMIFTCWTPVHVVLVITRVIGMKVSDACFLLAIVFSVLSVVLSPSLYAYRSSRINSEVRKVLLGKARYNRKHGTDGEKTRSVQLKRLKSFSCPHLLISSATEPNIQVPFLNENCGEITSPVVNGRNDSIAPDSLAKRLMASIRRRFSDPQEVQSTLKKPKGSTENIPEVVIKAVETMPILKSNETGI